MTVIVNHPKIRWTGKNYEKVGVFIKAHCGLMTIISFDSEQFKIIFDTSGKTMTLNRGDFLVACGPTIPGWNPDASLPLRVERGNK